MTSLFQMDRNITILHNMIESLVDPNTGEVPHEVIQQLIEAEASIPDKVNDIVEYLKYCERMAEVADKYVKDYQEKKRKILDRHGKIKKYVADYMKYSDKQAIDTGLSRVSLRKSKAVIIEGEIDRKYLTEKISYTPDKKTIKQAIEQGDKVKNARLEENYYIQIK